MASFLEWLGSHIIGGNGGGGGYSEGILYFGYIDDTGVSHAAINEVSPHVRMNSIFLFF